MTQKLTIDVRGGAGSGKTTVAAVIAKTLKEYGLDVTIIEPVDAPDHMTPAERCELIKTFPHKIKIEVVQTQLGRGMLTPTEAQKRREPPSALHTIDENFAQLNGRITGLENTVLNALENIAANSQKLSRHDALLSRIAELEAQTRYRLFV